MFTSTTLAVLGLAALGSAHVKINTPTPFGASTLNNSPLLADGSDFPCKQRTGVYDAEGASNTWPLGSTQKLAFTGSAVHGGGSCQVSISYDEAPTASSTWKVIHSIEGGCPMKGVVGNNGDDASAVSPDTYSFTVPTTLPTGTAVMAWTWFNKIGNREMYMNCAPITLTSGSSKRSDEDEILGRNVTQLVERDQAAFNALPDMFVANIGGSCGTVDSKDVIFPNPGDSLELDGTATSTALAAPTGCAAGTGGSSQATATAGSGSGSGATSVAASSPKATQKATSSAAGIPGGVFATVPTSAASEATSAPVVSAAPVATQASSAAPIASPVASSASPAASSGTSTGTSGSGTAQVAGSACTTEGMWNCIGGSSFQQCASGTWSVVQQLAAGTTCSAGQSAAINITASTKAKRAIRFSGEHIRRHIHKS